MIDLSNCDMLAYDLLMKCFKLDITLTTDVGENWIINDDKSYWVNDYWCGYSYNLCETTHGYCYRENKHDNKTKQISWEWKSKKLK